MAKLLGAEKYTFYYGAKPEGLRLAGDLRHRTTNAEKLLWKELRNRKVAGFRFRRQHPILEFIVDFFCYEASLVIELDGDVHLDAAQQERDIERTRLLISQGIRVIRFKNDEVERDIQKVICRIREVL